MNHQNNNDINYRNQNNDNQNQNYGQTQFDQSNDMNYQSRQNQNIQGQGQYNQQYQNQQQHNPYHGGTGQYQTRQPTGQQQTTRYQTGQQTVQQPMMIKNPSSNIVQNKGPQLNERDYLNDILANEKYLTDNFNIFAREASHSELHNDVMQILNETHDCTRNIFNLMFKNGFYGFTAASTGEIQQTQQNFSNYFNTQNPYGNNQGQNY